MLNLISQDYLMHHGVKGMKWGVRNDPQPTGRMRRRAANQQYRQSVKAAGRRNIQAFRENYGSREARRSANQQFRNEVNAAKQKNKEAFALSNKQKKLLKGAAIGAAVVGAAGLAAYGKMNIRSISLNPAAKQAFSKGAKYLRMGKTDAKIMKIGVQDAISNSKAVSKGKSIVSGSKVASNISRKARMAKTDAKIVKIATKDAVDNSKRRISNFQKKISVDRSLSKIHKNVKKLEKQQTKELQKNILKNKTAAQKRQFYKDIKRIEAEQRRADEEARAIRKKIKGY